MGVCVCVYIYIYIYIYIYKKPITNHITRNSAMIFQPTPSKIIKTSL